MKSIVRHETNSDVEAIAVVNRLAFGQDDEGDLVDSLRQGDFVALSMVAVIDERVVGHIMLSQLEIISEHATIAALALAPMAVLPDFQGQGIGSQLISAALDQCRHDGHTIVIVLGHPNYYPRFGFSTELAKPLESIYAGDSFMAMELVAGALRGVTGSVRYSSPFDIDRKLGGRRESGTDSCGSSLDSPHDEPE